MGDEVWPTKDCEEREREFGSREREREREWFGEHLLHSTLCIKHLCFAFDQMSSWYSAAGYAWWTSTWQLEWKVRSTNDDADAPQTSAQVKIAVLKKTLVGVGDDEPVLAGKRVLEKELEKLHRKLSGPKKTAKHIEAKQNWINRESKRLESESAKLAEWQESVRVRKETLRVAYEGIKILREDLLREGKSVDKNKSRFMSPENTEETRILQQQE